MIHPGRKAAALAVFSLSAAALALADGSVHIPMAGATESLNVAMAATVCLFEQMRQRMQAV